MQFHPRMMTEVLRQELDVFECIVVTRVSGVILPPDLYELEEVVLHIGDRMPISIPNWCLDDWGWAGTLSFRGEPHKCQVPWHAVRALGLIDRSFTMVWSKLVEPSEKVPEFFEGRRVTKRGKAHGREDRAIGWWCPRRQRDVDDCEKKWACRGTECGYGVARSTRNELPSHLKVVK